MKKIKFVTVIIFLSCFFTAVSQENTVKKNIPNRDVITKNPSLLHTEIEKFILDSNVDSIWSICSKTLKQNKTKNEIKTDIENINIFLQKNNFKNFDVFNNKGKNVSTGHNDKIKYNRIKYSYTPNFVKNKINSKLLYRLNLTISINLVLNGNTWELDFLEFKGLDFNNNYNIEQYVKKFLSDTGSYSLDIQLYKKDNSIVRSQGEIKELNLNFSTFEKLEIIDNILEIDNDQYTRISIRRKKLKNYNPSQFEEKEHEILEILFTERDKILISDWRKYGFYLIKGESNIIDFIKEKLITFAKNGYD